MEHPDFDKIKNYAEFSGYYWYRTELMEICRTHGIPCGGSKPELEKAIEEYLRMRDTSAKQASSPGQK